MTTANTMSNELGSIKKTNGVCVSCGQPLECVQVGERFYNNHKCSEKHEAAKQAAQTRHFEPEVRRKSYGERLSEGMAMLRMASK